jgi:hypothetical protein
MFKKIFTSHYLIAGIVVFFLLLGIFVFGVGLGWGESLLASAVLTAIGIAAYAWREFWPF